MPRVVSVFAIVHAGGPASVRTPNGVPLRSIASGPIAALVRNVARPPAASPAQMRLYDRQMRELAERFTALLPARFSTVMPPDELRFILSSRRRELQRALAHVRGRSQMTVRIVNRGRTPRAAGRSTVGATGSEYLRARAQEAAAARTVPGFEPLRAAVERWIRDERVEHRDDVSTIYHLIPRASSTRYRQALETAAAAAAVPAVVSGPWPPYAFTSP